MQQWGEDGKVAPSLKEVDDWLPYSQSPRPYAVCGVTVHSITLRVFRTIQSFVISRQLFLIVSVPFSQLCDNNG